MKENNGLVHFYFEDVDKILWNTTSLGKWINSIAAAEKYDVNEITYILCTDEYLHDINLKYLSHDTLTDIITFDLSDDGVDAIEAEIYISVDRVKENASQFNTTFESEISRVLAHGVLHLCGYKDKSNEESITMREKENFYIASSPLIS